jgi:hypothetical protein
MRMAVDEYRPEAFPADLKSRLQTLQNSFLSPDMIIFVTGINMIRIRLRERGMNRETAQIGA